MFSFAPTLFSFPAIFSMFTTMSQNEKAATCLKMKKLLQCSQDHYNLFLFSITFDICHLSHEKEMNIENQNVYLTLKKFMKKNNYQ